MKTPKPLPLLLVLGLIMLLENCAVHKHAALPVIQSTGSEWCQQHPEVHCYEAKDSEP